MILGSSAGAVIALFLLGSRVLASWDQGRPGDNLGDPEIVVERKLVSPDGSRIVISYSRDIGGLGYGVGGSALLPADSTDRDMRRTLLPELYRPQRWERDGSLTVTIDYLFCLEQHLQCQGGHRILFNTPVNVVLDDGIGERTAVVEERLTSPDGQLDLVAYRYPKDGNLNPIHVSIVRAGAPFPKYGNFFIGHVSGDGLLGGHWSGARHITFFTNVLQEDFSTYGFIDNPWGVRHSVVVIPGWNYRYLWRSGPTGRLM